MRFSSWIVGLATALTFALSGCGGGGAGGDPLLGGGGGNGGAGTPSKVDVQASSTTLGDGESTVLISAVVKDASNATVPNATVQWSIDAGYLLESTSITDSNGRATARYGSLDRSKAKATVTVTAGTAKGAIDVNLVANREISVDSPAKTQGVALNGETATITATVKDANTKVAIAGASVAWTTDTGTLRSVTTVTDASGVATAVFSAGSTFERPSATITLLSGGKSGQISIPVVAVPAKAIELIADANSIGTGGDEVTIRAFVKNGVTNTALTGEQVRWSTSSGTLRGQTSVTDASGVATAILSAGGNKRNRDAEVTVSSGTDAKASLTIPIVDTAINYSGTSSLALDTTAVTKLTFTLVDSKGITIAGESLGFTSSLGSALVPSNGGTTNAAGQVVVDYTPSRAGTDRIIATGAGATRSIEIAVSGSDEKLNFSLTGATSIPVGQSKSVSLQYLVAGSPVAGKTINLAATVGTLSASSVVTDGSGSATFQVSSSFAGTSTITGAVADSSLRATTQIGFVATTPSRLILQVTRSALPPTTDPTNLQVTTLSAKVLDSNYNPVPGITVNFSQQADPSQGVLQQASADTNASGIATVQYQSGPLSTASGAVVLKATVASSPTVSSTTLMTVNERALFIILATGNTISNYDEQTYLHNWDIYVTDANGVRVANKLVTLKVLPTTWRKGYMQWVEDASLWLVIQSLSCPNEDGPDNLGIQNLWQNPASPKPSNFNYNGILDAGEDLNGDSLLTPGNVALLSSSVVTTDSNGFATFSIRYGELYVPWISVRITATATVEGTESTSFRDFDLVGIAGDFSVKTVAPAGAKSPFGVDTTTCTNSR